MPDVDKGPRLGALITIGRSSTSGIFSFSLELFSYSAAPSKMGVAPMAGENSLRRLGEKWR
jgi:hypothetical protein